MKNKATTFHPCLRVGPKLEAKRCLRSSTTSKRPPPPSRSCSRNRASSSKTSLRLSRNLKAKVYQSYKEAVREKNGELPRSFSPEKSEREEEKRIENSPSIEENSPLGFVLSRREKNASRKEASAFTDSLMPPQKKRERKSYLKMNFSSPGQKKAMRSLRF